MVSISKLRFVITNIHVCVLLFCIFQGCALQGYSGNSWTMDAAGMSKHVFDFLLLFVMCVSQLSIRWFAMRTTGVILLTSMFVLTACSNLWDARSWSERRRRDYGNCSYS